MPHHHKKGSRLITDGMQQIYVGLRESEMVKVRELMRIAGFKTPSKWVMSLIRKELGNA